MNSENWVEVVQQGSPPEPTLLEAFRELTDDLGGRAQEREDSQPSSASLTLTGNRETDVWRACVAAWARLKEGRPYDAIAAVTPVASKYAPVEGSDSLLDAELLTILGECFSKDHRTVPAANFTHSAREVLVRFLNGCARHPDRSAAEIAPMLQAFGIKQSITAPFLASPRLVTSLLPAWAVTRGLDLLTEIARRRLEYLEDGRDAVEDLLGDVRLLVKATRTRLDDRQVAKVQIAIGDCCELEDSEMAVMCYLDAVKTLGTQDPLGFKAAVKLALMSDDAEAEGRFVSLKETAEARGDLKAAAQLWIYACVARWQATRDVTVRRQLVAAIDLYERELPANADPRTIFNFKGYLETGYRLLMTVNGYDDDRSDERLDEILSAIRAMMTAERRADLRPDADDDLWEIMLSRQMRPLAALRTALSPLLGLGILHLALGVRCLVWVAYGFAADGEFRAGWGICDENAAQRLVDVHQSMQEQLEADKIGDALAVGALNRRLEQLGDEIGRDFPAEVESVVRSMEGLVYAPVPVGNADEFPLAAIRIDGRWLTDIVPTTRTTTFNLMHGLLCPSLPDVQPDGRAVVALGAPDIGGPPLKGALNHAIAIQQMLEQIGFQATIADKTARRQLAGWLDGNVGVLHYVGHGIADEILESLPLSDGDFDATDAENFRGYHLPFVFLCACVAGRIRYGEGGHIIGLLSGLLDRGAPAGVAFTLPMPERHAYAIASQFYRQAARRPFAEAVSATQASVRSQIPAYAWLSIAAHGDPTFSLPSKAGPDPISILRNRAATWHSVVRKHCVLQTGTSAQAVRDRLKEAPTSLVRALEGWSSSAFGHGADDPSWAQLEEQAATATELSDVERLTAHAAACAARLYTGELHAWPLRMCRDPFSLPTLLSDAIFLSRFGVALADERLIGVGVSLIRRVEDLLDIAPWGELAQTLALSDAVAKLWECENFSPFVAMLQHGNREILAQSSRRSPSVISAEY
jgi:hypothetical protein